MDGIKFDGKKEAARYKDLKYLQRVGEISDLRLQPKFELIKSRMYHGKRINSLTYKADFQYVRDGVIVVEDVKSVATAKNYTYIAKKKLFIELYGEEYKFEEYIY